MKKKSVRKTKHHRAARKTRGDTYLIWIRSWMLVVVFALMLGVGLIVGNFLRTQLDQVPAVAGSQVEVR